MINTYLLKRGIPVTQDPYGDLAKILKIEKKDLIEILNNMILEKQIIKFRALLDHEKLGYRVNALIAMLFDKEEYVNNIISMAHITHFYVREPDIRFPFKYFAMAHFHDEEELKKFSDELNRMNVRFEILRTIKDLRSE
ncbi:MAG: hypothetical protein ACP5RZ_05245 [Thermoplasmata archaeon]